MTWWLFRFLWHPRFCFVRGQTLQMHLKLSFEPLDSGYLKNEKMIEIEGWIQSGCESFLPLDLVTFYFYIRFFWKFKNLKNNKNLQRLSTTKFVWKLIKTNKHKSHYSTENISFKLFFLHIRDKLWILHSTKAKQHAISCMLIDGVK